MADIKMTALAKAEDMFGLDTQTAESMHKEVVEHVDIKTYIHQIIKVNKLSTIGLDYHSPYAYLTVKEGSQTQLLKFQMSEDDYNLFCQDIGIAEDEEYNSSSTSIIEGVACRVFAITKPISKNPIVTISTTKDIPANVIKNPKAREVLTDELLDKIVHSTFIVAGGSGAGKTYFLNGLLGNYINDDERLAIVEEFGELTPPNDLTISMTTPPVKPGQEPKLRWVTEASNLMRLDGLVVGEIKSSEAYPFILNASSGTRGIATVHGSDARKALNRLTSLAMLATDNKEAIQEFIAKSVNYVIVMRKHDIFEIVELTGNRQGDNFALKRIYQNPSLLKKGEAFN